MAQNKEEKGGLGKKTLKTIGMAVLIPIMIIVLISSLFFAIIDGVIGVITGIITTMADIITRPLDYLEAGWSGFRNWFSTHIWNTGFDPRNI